MNMYIKDQISINFNGTENALSRSTVQNAMEGQVNNIDSKDVLIKGIVRTDTTEKEQEVESKGVQSTLVSTRKTFSNTLEQMEEATSLEEKEKIKKQIDGIINALSEEDYKALQEEETPLEEYSASQLERALERIKKQRVEKEDHLEKQVEKKEEKREQLVKTTGIKKKLEEANLPTTEDNLQNVEKALEYIATVTTLSDASKSYLVGNAIPLTAENIYRANYSGNSMVGDNENNETFEQVKDQIYHLLEGQGVSIEDETVEYAKWLFQQDQPIDAHAIGQLQVLDQLSSMDQEQLTDLFLSSIKDRENPTQVDLGEVLQQQTLKDKAVESIELVEHLVNQEDLYLEEEGMVTLEALSKSTGDRVTGFHEITARRQLEEVRVKLTLDHAYTLYKQGIQVNTTQLSELLNQLQQLEYEYYQELAMEDQGKLEADQLQLISDTLVAREQLREIPYEGYKQVVEHWDQTTLAALLEAKEEVVSGNRSKVKEYQLVETTPRKELGDSIEKAFQSMDTLLEQLEIEPTEENIRAVKILSHNNMELTNEKIQEMKEYDQQINQVIEQLRPEMVVKLIREQNNPLTTPIETLNQQLQELQEGLDPSIEQKFSEYLYQLDQKRELSSNERESYIGMYRLLHQIEKEDRAALGAVVNAGQEVTLENLLTAVRSKSSTGFDHWDGESTTTSNGYENSILDQLAKGFSSELAADALELYQQKGMPSAENQYDTFVATLGKQQVVELVSAMGLPISANNVKTVEQVCLSKPSFFTTMIEGLSSVEEGIGEEAKTYLGQLFEAFGEEEETSKIYEKIETLLSETSLEQTYPTYANAKSLEAYADGLQLAGQLRKKQIFEVPVVKGQEIIHLKVQLQAEEETASKLRIRLNQEEFGQIDISLRVKDGQVEGTFFCETRPQYEELLAKKAELKDGITKVGFSVGELHITMNKKESVFYDRVKEGDSTGVSYESLYALTKEMVFQVIDHSRG